MAAIACILEGARVLLLKRWKVPNGIADRGSHSGMDRRSDPLAAGRVWLDMQVSNAKSVRRRQEPVACRICTEQINVA